MIISSSRLLPGRTGHTEVVQVVFYPEKVSFTDLLKVFWESHDPTQGTITSHGSVIGSKIWTGFEIRHIKIWSCRLNPENEKFSETLRISLCGDDVCRYASGERRRDHLPLCHLHLLPAAAPGGLGLQRRIPEGTLPQRSLLEPGQVLSGLTQQLSVRFLLLPESSLVVSVMKQQESTHTVHVLQLIHLPETTCVVRNTQRSGPLTVYTRTELSDSAPLVFSDTVEGSDEENSISERFWLILGL